MDVSLVDWSRAQFALTAIYHWFFVPLTLGLSFIVAFMETIYVRTGNEEWKKITKFWMTLFGINFAIGVATGIILEFEFGTNWSNYSWFVGDIFGAPLAVEGIMAFFLESTFIAVMFFGWNKVGKGFHLASTWLVAIGANLSALWILVANAWMQYPVGMHFNPDTARNEMLNFWDVLLSPVAINKFLHTVQSGYVLASVFVIGVSAWYLLKKREVTLATRSMKVAGIFGLVMSVFIIVSGDSSARLMARHQPVKFAAMENLYEGRTNAPLVAFGILRADQADSTHKKENFITRIEIPDFLSYMAFLDVNAYVPGIRDLIHGNPAQQIMPVSLKMEKGKSAIAALRDYKAAKRQNDAAKADSALNVLKENIHFFGYGYLKEPADAIPPIPLTFYSFRGMVGLGFWFIALFILTVIFVLRKRVEHKKWFHILAILSIPLAYLATQMGWIVAEVGRQPWVIQDMMPTVAAVSAIETGSVIVTFILFAVTFTVLLIAEIMIMVKQIKKGTNEKGGTLMFEQLSYTALQQYWWIIVSLLGSLLVFLLFVQGGQTLIYRLGKDETQRTLIVNVLGRKWEFTFTTLVTFGGAFFASFPLFYSTSFGGAYWVWMIILFAFVIQAVSYEFRSKPGNFLGKRTFETFLFINGLLGTILLGAAVSTFFTGSQFSVDENHFSRWETATHGLEAAFNVQNLSLGLAVFFLARTLAVLYFIQNIDHPEIIQRARRQLLFDAIPFVVFFLLFTAMLLLKDGFAVDPQTGIVSMERYKYLHNFLQMPVVAGIFLTGVILVLLGILRTAVCFERCRDKGIWLSGTGTVLTVFALFLLAGFNHTAFYPSTFDLQSSLTIGNSSSSRYTLTVMSYVSLFVPVVLAYVFYTWRAINRKKTDVEELEQESHKY